MNVESAEDEEIFKLHVPDQDRGLIVGRTASDNLYVTLYDVANNPAATFESKYNSTFIKYLYVNVIHVTI